MKLHSQLEESISNEQRNKSQPPSSNKKELNVFKDVIEDDNETLFRNSFNILDDSSLTAGNIVSPRSTPASFTKAESKFISQPRKMTFIQLNDLISELAATKTEVDIKNLESRMPKRTMEAHLHEIFKTKFGLRNMIVENLASFLHTLHYYANYDTRARAFLAILRNECEEEFLYVIDTVEKTLLVLLKVGSSDPRCSSTAALPTPRRIRSTRPWPRKSMATFRCPRPKRL